MRIKTLVWATLLVCTFTFAGHHAFAGDPRERGLESAQPERTEQPMRQETSAPSFPNACYQDLDKADYIRKELVLIDPDEGWPEAMLGRWAGGYWVGVHQNGASFVIFIETVQNNDVGSGKLVKSYNLVRPERTSDGCGDGDFQRHPTNTAHHKSWLGGAGNLPFSSDEYSLWLWRTVTEGQEGVETVDYFLSGEATFIDEETGKPRQNRITVKAVDKKTVEALEHVYRKLNPGTPDLISQR